jgi:hypothetical protein
VILAVNGSPFCRYSKRWSAAERFFLRRERTEFCRDDRLLDVITRDHEEMTLEAWLTLSRDLNQE